ncbi:AraC family transcriptional regulator (plasmid) [Rhizobium sp. ACO-34A]|nr:AraC family transcriptional regulator [Rhizobium sp. ACO-34A]
MLDLPSNSDVLPVVDPLTLMLQGLRLDGIEYDRSFLSEPWAFSFPAQSDAYFHFVAENACWLQSAKGDWIQLGLGDAVLLPRGDAHVLTSSPNATAQPLPRWEFGPTWQSVIMRPSDATGCMLFSGSMRFNLDVLHPILRIMPDVMQATELMQQDQSTAHLLDAMASEIASNRVGACGIVARLADVLTAQIIRSWVEHASSDAAGWIAAVRHPDIGPVLAAIHAEPDKDWSVAGLAAIMGASRSTFASKFAEIVGETPVRYLAQIRMHQARQWIVRDHARISDIAQRLGYESEASFSRAFKRIIGSPPSRFRTAVKTGV